MEKEYRFANRKGRAIQVMYKNDCRWISTGCYTMSEAEAWAVAHLHTARKDLTLREYASGFFTKADPRGQRQRNENRGHFHDDSYYSSRQSMLDRFILPVHGGFKMVDITPRMVEKLIFDIERSNDTRNKILYAYRTVLQSAKEDLLIPTNPIADLKPLAEVQQKRESFSDKEIEILFPSETDKLITLWGGEWWTAYFSVMHETGWRPSEVAALRKDHIYPDKLAVYTDASVSEKSRCLKDRIKTTGHGFDYKIGFVSERTMNMLINLSDENGYLFCKGGKFIIANVANKHLKGVCNRCNIPVKTQYSFRHTFDSQLFGAVPDEFRKMLMGHSGKSNYDYLHLKPEEAIERAEKLKKSN